MILTGKAKEDFINWKNKNYPNEYYCTFTSMPEISKFALIIEWFESLGIYIGVFRYPSEYVYEIHSSKNKKINCSGCSYDTRLDATSEAIAKANEIYNSI